MTAGAVPDDSGRLFVEEGASWWWLLGGPLAAAAMLFIQSRAGVGFQPLVPAGLLVILTLVLSLQVKAARLHTSVELTREALREGAETILLSEIVSVYPEAGTRSGSGPLGVGTLALLRGRVPVGAEEGRGWQSARSLGELNGVPKGRTGIGLKLTNDRTAQAWARDHEELRKQLTRLIEDRIS